MIRGARLLMAVVLAATTGSLTACADAGTPFEPTAAESNLGSGERLEGSYELVSPVTLGSGDVLYAVGVHFGTGERADGATYLVQAGVRSAANTSLKLLQNTYRVVNDQVQFTGGLLQQGTLSADRAVLKTTLTLEGEQVPLELKHR